MMETDALGRVSRDDAQKFLGYCSIGPSSSEVLTLRWRQLGFIPPHFGTQYQLPARASKIIELFDINMKKIELKRVLDCEGYRPECYDLDGGLLPERLTLANEMGKWAVYYSERGQRTGKRCFATEREACEYFLKELRDDPSALR